MINQYMNNLYNDLLSNSPQTVTIDIPASMGTGQISQIVTKQGAVVSDWKMNYFSDVNVQGVNSEEYIQILFCFNEGVSWSIADSSQSTSMQKGESCENEEKMEAAIAELVKGKTLFVIAHKLPAIMNADQICVIEHGKLAATGTHKELLQTCGEYQKLWKAAQGSAEWKVTTAKEGK